MNENFAKRLVYLRNEKGLTQDKFAELMGVSKSSISMYENGKRTPDFELEEKIADFFNVDLDYLRGRSDIKNKYRLENKVSSKINPNEIIKKRRKELGLTLKQVAEQLGVSESLISRYESNDVKNMGIDKIKPLAKILKCEPEYLMGWVKNNDTTETKKDLTKDEQLINEISTILIKNSNCSLSNIKRGNKVDIIKDEKIIATYDIELVFKAFELKYIKDNFSLEDIENLFERFDIPEDLKGVTRKQYIKFMGESAMFFDDDSISDDTKAKLLLAFQKMFYDAKEKNKRKK